MSHGLLKQHAQFGWRDCLFGIVRCCLFFLGGLRIFASYTVTSPSGYAKFKAIREEYQQIHHIQSCVNKGLGNVEQAQQKKDNRKQEER